MDSKQPLQGNSRIVRVLLAAALGVAALLSLRNGKRLRGALAGAGAIALGYSVTSDTDGVTDSLAEELDIDGVAESDESRREDTESEPLRCAACGDPIVAGQIRVPNEDDETVHETCLEATA